MQDGETPAGVYAQRLPDGTLVVIDGIGGEIRLAPDEARSFAETLMEYSDDTDDWPDAQRSGAT